MGPQDRLQNPEDRIRELSKNMDKVTAIQTKLEYLLSHPQSISSISEGPCWIRSFVVWASLVASPEALVQERILMRKDGLVEQFVSLPTSQIEVCSISGLVATMRLQATVGAVGRTVGAEEVGRS